MPERSIIGYEKGVAYNLFSQQPACDAWLYRPVGKQDFYMIQMRIVVEVFFIYKETQLSLQIKMLDFAGDFQ